MPTFKTINTNQGLTAISAAIANNSTINLTHMAVGDGNGNAVTPVPTQTGLVRETFRATVNRVFQSPTIPGRFTAELVIPAATGGFTLREVGIFNSSGTMFAVGNLPDTYKPVSTEGAYSDTVVRVEFQVANASIITLQVDPNVAVATQQWISNNVTAGVLLPGGTTGQVLRKKSNTSGDVEWKDPTSVNVTVNAIEETQTLTGGQTVVNWAVVNNTGLAVYKNGIRLLATQFTKDGSINTRITLATAATAGDKLVGVQNDAASALPVPLEKSQNLADVPNKALARTNLDVFSKAEARELAPAGQVADYAMASPPTGWIKANGAAVSRTAYATLFAAVGTAWGTGDGFSTFNVPDFRGEFRRGWDDSRGVDTGRAFGTAQASQNLAHGHTGTTSTAGAHQHGLGGGYSMARYGYDGGDYGAAAGASISATTDSAGDHSHGVTIDNAGGSEARPRNLAVLVCIKY